MKKRYISPEFEWLEVKLLDDVLSWSIDGINQDHNDVNDDLLQDETDPDVNNNFYDIDDSDLFN